MAAISRNSFVAPFENTNKDFGTVFWEFLSTRQKDVIKLFSYTMGWGKIALGTEDPAGKLAGRVSSFAGDAKNLLSFIEIPQRTTNLRKAVSDFIAEPSMEAARNVALRELPNVISEIGWKSDRICRI